MQTSPTVFGSVNRYDKGGVQVMDADARHYAFSNVFDVAARSQPWERVAVGKNLKYVLEAVRAEGTSPWFANAHDESLLVMDGDILIEYVRPNVPAVSPGQEGAVRLANEPSGTRMGWVRAGRGHMALLPAGCAYRLQSRSGVGALLIQTIAGPETIERWADICQIA
jgi:hypothetical protein